MNLKIHSIIFFFLSLGLVLNTFGSVGSKGYVGSKKTRFPAGVSTKNELVEDEDALLNPDDTTLAFNQTQTSTMNTSKTTTSNTSNAFDEINVDEGPKNYYLSLGAGILNFPDVGNIRTFNGAGGVGLGASLTPRLKIEASFIYSFQQIEISQFVDTLFDDVDQYSFNATGVYHWDVSWPVTPITGVTASLTRRQYNEDEVYSDAFDMGLVLGVEKPVNPRFSFGLEYRYMVNVDYERDFGISDYNMDLQSLGTSSEVRNLESFNYQVVFLNTRFKF